MRRSAIAQVGLLVVASAGSACSFIDDFDKFKAAPEEVGEDSGLPADELDADVPAKDRDATVRPDGSSLRDGSVPAEDAAPAPRDAAAEDAGDAAPVSRCGDGVTDKARGEQCDDGNQIAGDGCEPLTCTLTPSATCAGKSCDDDDVCTTDTCDPVGTACVHRAIDIDNDGFSPGKCKGSSGLQGGDCNDANAAIKPNAPELCDGIDNDCDGTIDDGLAKLRCYPDLDNDGYANLAGMERSLCSCPAGTIAVENPSDKTLNDCWDDPNGGASVFPKQTRFFIEPYGMGPQKDRSYDYDCSDKVDQQYKALGAADCGGLLGVGLCSDAAGFAGTTAPACGVVADYVICTQAILGACGSTEQRTQGCH